MKTNIILLFVNIFILLSCNRKNNPEFIYLDGSDINGQLCYSANPFNPETDTVLCLKNVDIGFTGYDADYCSYVRALLSQVGGKFEECQSHEGIKHNWAYLAESEQCFYPICNKQFVSVIDPNTGSIADSICLNDRTIYPKRKRNGDSDYATHSFTGDFVLFQGSDYMKPKFITDTIMPSGELIICFDGHRGPFRGDPSLTNDNPNIFN